ncbi:3-deoxy-D-manno-octulosonic acid kinase [Maribrevibacterium harenarium]|uniref:3-deoxy-D-manno-octulosonic acid kinase n=1 Tax=Maribrevibacterium harenarium TaxID=2589817 RepID=A0A501WT62_9GAMM|nr:3-deoxy-D-manno-octulosonic acid kinase [Maribrevibacterium harenarium]TPE51274.1 3-deoxy-D-manno-octulosonic acid kinase [Maribrevibacterium harenarium]
MPKLIPLENGRTLIQVGKSPLSADYFDPHWWQQLGKVNAIGQGRGEVWFVHHQSQDWVLRRYRRGGLIGKFNRYLYLPQPLTATRPYRELDLLERMCELGLPVPTPIGGLIIRTAFGYQAWLLTRRIDQAKDLFDLLRQSPLTETTWHSIGQTIRNFHNEGIFHSDLNCHNIMIDTSQRIWLIDFDKCDQRAVASSWQQANLARLRRSFEKESSKHAIFHWHQQAWQWLLGGYQHG